MSSARTRAAVLDGEASTHRQVVDGLGKRRVLVDQAHALAGEQPRRLQPALNLHAHLFGTLAEKAAAAGFDVAIVTLDKDFFQLVRDGIRVFNPRDEGTWYDATGVKEKLGVTPDQVADVLALMGDTIDNIKGVPGIGEKGARDLVAAYGSIENLIAHAGEISQKRYREPLLANTEAARQSLVLARIRTDVPVDPLRRKDDDVT